MAKNAGVDLEDLKALVPPPSAPSEPFIDRRQQIEKCLGFKLPDDYCALASQYGTGSFETTDGILLFSLLNPFSRAYFKRLHAHSIVIRDRQLSQNSAFKAFDVYPHMPGLVSVGSGEEGRFVCWKLEKARPPWPLAVFPPDNRRHRPFQGSVVSFLVRQFSGKGSEFGGSWDRRWFKHHIGSFRFSSSPPVGTSDFPNLHMEASAGRHEYVSQLIAGGADPNGKDYEGRTPLLHAIDQCSVETIRVLLELGSDPDTADPSGTTPLHEAMKVHLSIDGVELLLRHGASIEAPDKLGRSILFYAVMYGSRQLTKYLIDKGANINARDIEGSTPLAYAEQRRMIRDLLIRHGATK